MEADVGAAWAQAHAQWAQAIALAVAAIYGALNLGNWRRELYRRRQVEVAEQCLIAGSEAISSIRRAREPVASVEVATGEQRTIDLQVILQKRRGENLDLAWSDWRNFANKYRLASIFLDTPQRSLADAVSECLTELSDTARLIQLYEDTETGQPSPKLVSLRRKFLRPPPGAQPDDLERRLCNALRSLEGCLGPVLNPQRFAWWRPV